MTYILRQTRNQKKTGYHVSLINVQASLEGVTEDKNENLGLIRISHFDDIQQIHCVSWLNMQKFV